MQLIVQFRVISRQQQKSRVPDVAVYRPSSDFH